MHSAGRGPEGTPPPASGVIRNTVDAAGALPGSSADLSMEGKYCIVTGSNSGIGLQVARGLMQRGAHVVMACRNMAACEMAAAELRREGLPGSCACRRVDLEDPTSIRTFARQQAAELADGLVGGVQQQDHQQDQRRSDAAASGAALDGIITTVGKAAAAAGGDAAAASVSSAAGGALQDGGGGGGGRAGGALQVNRRGGNPPPPRHLDVLVNNAGVMGVPPAADGSDRHLTANHLGPYLLTRLLLPHMTLGSRIINVASRAHYAGSLSLVTEPPGSEAIRNDTHHWWWQYARSKLCNVLFTAELQRRYGFGSEYAPRETATAAADAGAAAAGAGAYGDTGGVAWGGIGVYAVSPGMVDTGIFRHLLPGWAQWLRVPLRPLVRTPQQGAEVVFFAADSPKLQGRNTLFLHDCREMRPSAAARDVQLAADLWRVSAALVGLPEDDAMRK